MSYSMFSGVNAGLTNAFSILSSASGGSVTQTNISKAMGSSTYSAALGTGFASYILSNFATLDKDHDGTLSATELGNLTNSIAATGLTSSQLSQLGSASGLSSETLEQVLEHFSQIDANHDGKVTSSEINNFKLTSQMENKKTEFANKAAANQSIFYGDENASSTDDSSSMVSFMYWNNGNNNSSNKT